jgi:hypothetical protein
MINMRKRLLLSLAISLLLIAIYSVDTLAADIVKGSKSAIDVTNKNNGTISIAWTGGGEKKIKVIIEKSSEKYTYDLNNKGNYEIFPLQMGDGSYKIQIYANIEGTKYSLSQSHSCNVKLVNEFAPYLAANQYVNYNSENTVIKKSTELAQGKTNTIEIANAIFDYVVKSMTYDYYKAQTVQPGYLPDIDKVIEARKGICFDYAAVTAAMLRFQNIPTKLVTGYVAPDNIYHAWNEVYIKDVGWVKIGNIYFDGKSWKMTDMTFASSAINNNKTYSINEQNYKKLYQF